jgi:prepilin-type N-terminal cleavage/methylation domain-containing protein
MPAPAYAPARRGGFTLVEVVVAISVSGLVLLGAHALLVGVADATDRLTAVTREAERSANGERLLRTLFARVEVGTSPVQRFAGDPRKARFTSWCDSPRGWQERCEVAVVFDSLGGRPAFVVVLSTGEVLPLRTHFGSGELRYLADPAAGGSWVRQWGPGAEAPVAVGVIVDHDTMIVRIGERG